MSEKKPKSADKMVTRGSGGSNPKALGLWCFNCIQMEISGGRSSLLLAFAGSMHLNDFLHQAGLITDDCWNAVKGMSTLFSETANITAIAGSIGSVLKTVVEGATAMESESGLTERKQIDASTKLAALGGAESEEGA